MLRIWSLAFAVPAALLTAHPALADDWEELCKDGYGVVAQTSIDDEFEGCEHGKAIPLRNGMTFVCSEYSYSYEYNPDVYILQHVTRGDLKVVIEDEEYEGRLYRG